jgi:heme/copper-type cytochrome/quinol oxidase subunit 4
VRKALAGIVDFVVGDDVWTAVAVVLTVAAVAVVAHAGFDVWWLLPVVVPLAVLRSVKRAAGASR